MKIGDFSFSTEVTSSASTVTKKCGTSWYIAPEVYDNKCRRKSDIWSLGISIIELANGRNPFQGFSNFSIMKTVLMDKAPSLSSDKWSKEMVDFVDKCLIRNDDERWDASQLLEVTVGRAPDA